MISKKTGPGDITDTVARGQKLMDFHLTRKDIKNTGRTITTSKPSAHVAMSSCYLGSWRRFHPFGEFISPHGQMTGVSCQGFRWFVSNFSVNPCHATVSSETMSQLLELQELAELSWVFFSRILQYFIHNIIYKNGFSKGFFRRFLARNKIDNLRLLR